MQIINRTVEPLPFVRPPLARQERDLERVIKLIALFEPFILHNDHVFEAANVERLSEALPPDERAAFRIRRPLDRLVGLLDQRAHSGAAEVVLSSDRRPSAGSFRRGEMLLAGAPTDEAPRKRQTRAPARRPEPKHRGNFPDREHRLYRRSHRVESAGGSCASR